MVYYNFLLLFICLLTCSCEENHMEDTLVLVHVVVRHGERTPDSTFSFPNDIYGNLTYYPHGVGELNQKGIQNSYKFGKYLRNRYQNFLSETYYTGIVDALSSAFSRCRMTMQLILAGLFPPNETQTFQKGLHWQPIVFKYNKLMEDKILTDIVKCMHLLTSIDPNNYENVSVKCNNTLYLHGYLTLHSGLKVNSPKMILHIVDTIKSELENDLKLPAWAKPMYPEPLLTCANDYWRYVMADTYLLARGAGNLMEKIYNDTTESINNVDRVFKTKLFLYTAHDLNIFALLAMLDNYNGVMVNYLSAVIFEVHKINDVYGFKVYFDNRDNAGPILLDIPGCGTFCPVDRLYERVKMYFNAEPC